ncbi:MAG: ferritin-like domain-containing protein [Elusimicrobiota bacterium]|nr:MAG: ferritin-like domain-containing protein [Elusimicrobiota bacterium]
MTVLQNAYSGEYAASLAYGGHARSVSDPGERAEILAILDQELEHRGFVGGMLSALGAAPDPFKERLMTVVGTTISCLCRIGGWFIPMYGAGKLEAGNIVEYEVAAALAREAGHPELVECLLHMAEIEWDHEKYFRDKTLSSAWCRVVPLWPAPPPRADIRANFARGATSRRGAAA